MSTTPPKQLTVPVTVNVCATPGASATAFVQLTTCPAWPNAYPPGSVCVPLYVTSTGSVSVTVRLVSVCVPVFVTTIRYVTAPFGTGTAGVWLFTTLSAATGGFTPNTRPAALSPPARASPHASFCASYPTAAAWFPTGVTAHTSCTPPVIVKVYVAPGARFSPAAVHTNRVPLGATFVIVGPPNAPG